MLRYLFLAALATMGLAHVQAATCQQQCNQGTAQCLSTCPAQCPADPDCMKTCYATCMTEEKTCQKDCPSSLSSSSSSVHPAWVSTPLPESLHQSEFVNFVKKHSKTYTADEFLPRYNIFKANFNKIRHHNMGKHSYSLGVNEFADMTFEEFHAKMTGYNRRLNAYRRSQNGDGPHLDVSAPAESIDWRAKNAVTDVKNQQQCGSCWSFSATGSVEGAHAIKTGKLVALSEQQLVDCSTSAGNNGCNGGLMDDAFEWIIQNKGITSEEAYPYTAADGTCQSGKAAAATISSFKDVAANDEGALKAALNVGPVSVAIEADQQVFQFYSGGVLADAGCGSQLDHGVLVVGYGTDNGQDYWIVKNSWGASWGEKGYIRLARGSNECGIATEPSYPVV